MFEDKTPDCASVGDDCDDASSSLATQHWSIDAFEKEPLIQDQITGVSSLLYLDFVAGIGGFDGGLYRIKMASAYNQRFARAPRR